MTVDGIVGDEVYQQLVARASHPLTDLGFWVITEPALAHGAPARWTRFLASSSASWHSSHFCLFYQRKICKYSSWQPRSKIEEVADCAQKPDLTRSSERQLSSRKIWFSPGSYTTGCGDSHGLVWGMVRTLCCSLRHINYAATGLVSWWRELSICKVTDSYLSASVFLLLLNPFFHRDGKTKGLSSQVKRREKEILGDSGKTGERGNFTSSESQIVRPAVGKLSWLFLWSFFSVPPSVRESRTRFLQSLDEKQISEFKWSHSEKQREREKKPRFEIRLAAFIYLRIPPFSWGD